MEELETEQCGHELRFVFLCTLEHTVEESGAELTCQSAFEVSCCSIRCRVLQAGLSYGNARIHFSTLGHPSVMAPSRAQCLYLRM